MKILLVLLVGFFSLAPGFAQEGSASKLPVNPIDPISGILDAFKSHGIVALGEGSHGNEQGHAFRLSLVRDPRFAIAVDDIVVEFGNSLYQDLMDRFIRGEEVSDTELQRVWQNTTQFHTVWDRPIYEEFFRAVRAINAASPKSRQLRVLLGDSPIDVTAIKVSSDLSEQIRKVGNRDAFAAGLIQREVLDKKRKALLIYGDMHFLRKKVYYKIEDPQLAERFNGKLDTIVDRLEGSSATRVFSIWTSTFDDPTALNPESGGWKVPSLILLRGTSMGSMPFTSFYPSVAGTVMLRGPDGQIKSETLRPDPERAPSMQDQFDAILYIGPRSKLTYSKLAPELCADPAYFEMRSKRMALTRPPAPLGASTPAPNAEDTLKRECDRAKGQ